MYTLTRLSAAILLMLFFLWIAPIYDRIYDPDRPLRGLTNLLGTMGFIVGWAFLGGKARALWYSAYLGLQAVVLAGGFAAVLVAVRDVFVLGYRRRVSEPFEAVVAIPQIAWDYMQRALVPDLWVILPVGGMLIGVFVYVIDRALDRRRMTR